MTFLELLIDLHIDSQRQGPGSDTDTLKALGFIDIEKGKEYKIADIGCGTGAQTIALAKSMNAQITAVDLFPDFLDKLKSNAKLSGIQNKIFPMQASMDELLFEKETFDIIWSEGAIYNIGFENGIKIWKPFLKANGYIALTEITWLTKERPAEINLHWKNEYPEIDTASGKIKVLEENGFSPVAFFYLSESSWIDTYYQPMENRFNEFLNKHNFSDTAMSIVDTEKNEIALYKKYKDYISYGFYIAKKVN